MSATLKTACLSVLFCMPSLIKTFLLTLLTVAVAQAASFDTSAGGGSIRVHYQANGPAACDAILLGVGTAMSADNYDKLSTQLIAYGYVVAIIDHAPGELLKTNATQFANVASAVKDNLASWLAGHNNCTGIAHWIMGGHSAGGQAAHDAVVNNSHLADAMFNIDPYDISGSGLISVPTLNWGFSETTCFVDINKAAKAAYQKSTGGRAFVRVAKKYSWGPCGYSPKYFHCSFCDGHCPACTNCTTTPDSFFVDVARSVNKFINAAFYGQWSKSTLSFSSTTPITLFVDAEQP
jgi:hypothetical protein